MRTDDDPKQQPADEDQPDDAEPWAKTSSGDADSVTPDDDE